MAESNDEVRDNDKDTLMEVRGVIDGVVESGSTDYKAALNDILSIMKVFAKDNESCKGRAETPAGASVECDCLA